MRARASVAAMLLLPALISAIGWYPSTSRAIAAVRAHPPDFETLTLDFLIGADGLRWIDGAVVRGKSYEPFATPDARRRIATNVTRALQVPTDEVTIDAVLSARYHEAGFLIRFTQPSLGASADLRIDGGAMQKIAADAGARTLRLNVCGAATSPETSELSVLNGLVIEANEPANRAPNGFQDRHACKVWVLTATDEAIVVTVQAHTLPKTGMNIISACAAAVWAFVFGLTMLWVARYLRRRAQDVNATP